MLTILVIEEHDLSRDMLAKRFAHRGYHVLTSTDGYTGLSMAQAIQPDLVLPGMARPQDYQRSLTIGCDDCNTKPVDFQRLLSKVHFLLGEHVCP